MQLLEGAEKAGVSFSKRMGVNSVEELRKLDVKKILNDSASELGGFWPVVDGYVITGDQYKLYEAGLYNDVPVMVGNTSDEGTLFVMKSNVDEYVETTKKTYGSFADKLLSYYPAGDKDVTKRSMADLFRDVFFTWETYTWANLQTKTGKSPVFVYWFDQPQPTSMLTHMLNSNGAYHGSDCAYVFKHLDQNSKMKYTEEDKRLSETMITYWTNFAKYGNPNDDSLPAWPVYKPDKPTVMYLKSDLRPGMFPNLEKLKTIDDYYSSKRTEE
jgi:para-nitrobenzyl esterase